jgi:hypothetical protein
MYNQFKKLEQLREKFELTDYKKEWIPKKLPSLNISSTLLQALEEAKEEFLGTEKAKSEFTLFL